MRIKVKRSRSPTFPSLHVAEQPREGVAEDLHGVLVVLPCPRGPRRPLVAGPSGRARHPARLRPGRRALPAEEGARLLGRPPARHRGCGGALGRCNRQSGGASLRRLREKGERGKNRGRDRDRDRKRGRQRSSAPSFAKWGWGPSLKWERWRVGLEAVSVWLFTGGAVLISPLPPLVSLFLTEVMNTQ